MRISDWSSDVCSSDLLEVDRLEAVVHIAVDHARRTGNAFPRPQARGNALPLIVLQEHRKKPLKNEENFFDFMGMGGITLARLDIHDAQRKATGRDEVGDRKSTSLNSSH